jgi:hypothetical protein
MDTLLNVIAITWHYTLLIFPWWALGLLPIVLPIQDPKPGRLDLTVPWWHTPTRKELLLGAVRGAAIFLLVWMVVRILAYIST